MEITINDKITNLPPEITTVAELVSHLKIQTAGTAIAINSRLIKRETWAIHNLNIGDNIMIISATYGG